MPKRVRIANVQKSKVRSAFEHVPALQKGPMALVVRAIGMAREDENRIRDSHLVDAAHRLADGKYAPACSPKGQPLVAAINLVAHRSRHDHEFRLPQSPQILGSGRSVDSRAKRNGLSEADLHVFSKLFEDGLERGFEARHFLGVRLAVMTMSWISSSDI